MARLPILLSLSMWLALPAGATAAPILTTPRLLAPSGGVDSGGVADGSVVLVAPAGLLADPRVRGHLETGLTTTLAWRATAQGARGGAGPRGGARIEIRFEPWDEVFHAAALGVDGKVVRATLDTFAALEGWWRDLRLTVLRADNPGQEAIAAALGTVRLELDIVPFSEAEARDAQRWFSGLLERAGAGGGGEGGEGSAGETVTDAAEPGTDVLDQVLNTLVATSIRRRAVVSMRWRVAIEAGT